MSVVQDRTCVSATLRWKAPFAGWQESLSVLCPSFPRLAELLRPRRSIGTPEHLFRSRPWRHDAGLPALRLLSPPRAAVDRDSRLFSQGSPARFPLRASRL